MELVLRRLNKMLLWYCQKGLFSIGILAVLVIFGGESVNKNKQILVDVAQVCPNVLIDLRYATDNNFTGKRVYQENARCLLLPEVAQALNQANAILMQQGYTLKIWDAFRPLSAQQILWDRVRDERYVANPAKGGRHTRGTAVDCTLVHLDGSPVVMPTAFDDFTERAHSDYPDLPDEILKNRQLLHDAMRAQGFEPVATEWWHFDYKNWQEFPVLDDAGIC